MIDFDILIEIIRAALFLALFIYLKKAGKELSDLKDKGWHLLLIGFTLLLLSALIDITDNFESLNKFIIIGDTKAQSFIEKTLTGLGGVIFLVFGFRSWLPTIKEQQRLKDHLSEEVKLKTDHLIKTNEELTNSLKHAEQLRQSKSQFLSAIAHDIRTPLNAIISMSELARSENQPDFSLIESSSKMLKHFLNELLDLSKLESGEIKLNNSSFTIATLVKEVDNLFSLQAQEKGLFLCIQNQSLPTLNVTLDKERLLQVICNLISNALKFTSEGQISIKISNSEIVNEACNLVISVIDTGPGIPSEKIPEIFKAYEQLDTAERKFGSGLGLFICSEIIKLMHGDISCHSVIGAGTEFTLKIPILAETQDEKLMSEKQPLSALPSKLTAIITDDLEINRIILEKHLAKYCTNIEHAAHGLQLLNLIEKINADVIFIDYEMPGLDGLKVAEKLKENPKSSQIPLIMVTADNTISYNSDFKEHCDFLIEKPVTKSKIANIMASIQSMISK